MNGLRLAAIVLIVLGVLGLAYGAFGYNRETHRASVGGMEISVTEQRTVNVPLWAGVGAIGVGAVLLLARKKSKA
jgi:hypothetical protein